MVNPREEDQKMDGNISIPHLEVLLTALIFGGLKGLINKLKFEIDTVTNSAIEILIIKTIK